MRHYRAPNGEDAIFYERSEIEQMMQSELRKAGLLPTDDRPAVDMESFVEQHLKATLDQYAVLPQDVLGLTEFFEGQAPQVSLNKDLTGSALDDEDPSPGMQGRWRATLAHEAGHILLHRSLFEFAVGNMSLFSRSQPQGGRKLQRCLKRDVGFAGKPDWREYQANQAMAALLMPKLFFQKLARKHIDRLFPGHDLIPFGREEDVAAALAPIVEVSRQAARIRLNALGLVAARGQTRF